MVVTAAVPQSPVTVYDTVVVPAAIPVTIPVLPIVATEVLLLLHVPAGIASLSVATAPIHVVAMPDIGVKIVVSNFMTVAFKLLATSE